MCLPPQFGLEPEVQRVQQRPVKQPIVKHEQPQQANVIPAPVVVEQKGQEQCFSDIFQQPQQQTQPLFDYQSFDPLQAFDFNTNFILPSDDFMSFEPSQNCEDVLQNWNVAAPALDELIPNTPENFLDTAMTSVDVNAFFSDSNSYSGDSCDVKPSLPHSSSSSSSLCNPSNNNNSNGKKRKTRKRRLACDLSPSELARTREVNRIAAQRHRKLLKSKRSEQETRYADLCRKNSELRDTIRTLTAEARALQRIVVDIFAPKTSGSAQPSWNQQALFNAQQQQQVFC